MNDYILLILFVNFGLSVCIIILLSIIKDIEKDIKMLEKYDNILKICIEDLEKDNKYLIGVINKEY